MGLSNTENKFTALPFPLLHRRVISHIYSRAPDGNRNWRYRVVDVSVVVRGAPWLLEAVEEALEGAHGILMDLEFGAMGLYSNSTDSQSTTTATCTDMPLTNLTSTSTLP